MERRNISSHIQFKIRRYIEYIHEEKNIGFLINIIIKRYKKFKEL